MEITYNSHGFSPILGTNLRGTNVLTFNVQELMWSAVTVGRANYIDVLAHGIYSEYEILYRAAILISNLSLDGQHIVKSSAYENLDPSEKSAVSYFLGLTFTKLLASKLLNAPWLLHLDVYRQQFEQQGIAFTFGRRRTRPDLIGLDSSHHWIVMESKGRTNTPEPALLANAKRQSRNIRRIGGSNPSLRIGVVTHFRNSRLTVDWEDPESENENSFDLETERNEYLLNYYRLIYNVLSNNETKQIGRFIAFTFDSVNLTIGMDIKIYQAYASNNLGEVRPVEQINPEESRQIIDQETYSGPDGILIGLGKNWRDLLRQNKQG